MQGVDSTGYWGVFTPWVQYFTDGGHAIHGSYWNHSLGQENLSHGCINTSNEDALWFWRFASPQYTDLSQEEILGDSSSTQIKIK
jgi:lipoprotein-anchoring transpeptidase ErfK/SrfK